MAIIPGPSVAPQYYGGDVGGRIADAYMTLYQLNRQRDLDAIQYGLGLKWPSAADGEASSASGPAIGVGDRIRAALSHVGIGSNPIPAEQAQWRLNQGAPAVGVTPNGVQSPIATRPAVDSRAMPGSTLAPSERQRGGTAMDEVPRAPSGRQAWDESPDGASLGGLPDYMTLPNGQRIPTIMTPFGSRILQALATRAEIRQRGSEADKNTADADYTRHKNAQPLPGDNNYVTTMQPIWGGEAGAKAAAAYPYQVGVAKVRNQGTLGAAQIGAQSRVQVAGITQTGANTRQAGQQQWEQTTHPPSRRGSAEHAGIQGRRRSYPVTGAPRAKLPQLDA